MKRQSRREDGGRVGEETVHGRRAKKEKHFVPFSLRRSPSGTALFVLPSFARPRYTRVEEMRRREECRDREGERRRFFFVLLDESGAGQARGGRTNRKPGRGEAAGEREGERERERG